MTIQELKKAYNEYYSKLAETYGMQYCMAHCAGIYGLDYDKVMQDIDDEEQMEILCALFGFAYLEKGKEKIPFISEHKLVYGGE